MKYIVCISVALIIIILLSCFLPPLMEYAENEGQRLATKTSEYIETFPTLPTLKR